MVFFLSIFLMSFLKIILISLEFHRFENLFTLEKIFVNVFFLLLESYHLIKKTAHSIVHKGCDIHDTVSSDFT